MACIQTILMLRGSRAERTEVKLTHLPRSLFAVYALYIQDRRVAYAMLALLVAELGSMPGAIALTMPKDTGNMCMKPVKMRDIALFG